MRNPIPVLMLLAFAASPGSAQTALQLRWELEEDVFPGAAAEGASRAVFTLTNRERHPSPPAAGRSTSAPCTSRVERACAGGVAFERVTGDLLRIVPGAGFPGVAPGQSVEIEYLTPLITNISFAPAGPYVVFDEAPDRGHAIDYVAVPFERASRPGRDPRVVTPQAQYALDQAVRDIPLAALPPVFPTPRSLQRREGQLRLDGDAGGVGAAGAPGGGRVRRGVPAPARREGRRDSGGAVRAARDRPRRGPGLARGLRARRRPASRASACAAPRPPASSTACSP